MQTNKNIISKISAILFSAITAIQGTLAQDAGSGVSALEEIVVTAQRRVQSLQEVPISIYTISGMEIEKQGYRDLNELAVFSPTVNVDTGTIINTTLSIRGFGTTGFNVAIESAVPIFLDGVHLSRQGMMKTAFMDVGAVEILAGPQPVYFGNNAIAGAINIQSRKPTPEWEGNLNLEYGNNNTQKANAGIGGPLTDTLRMRIAGRYEDSNGYLEDVITGQKLPAFENHGGRFTLQWLPNDQLTATARLEGSLIKKDPEAPFICLSEGNMIFGRLGPLASPQSAGFNIGDGRSVFADPPKGEGWSYPHEPIGSDCDSGNQAISAGGPYLQAPDYIRYGASGANDFGTVDVREAAHAFALLGNRGGIRGHDYQKMWQGALDLNYDFDNGINVNWTTAYIDFLQDYVRDNARTPFFMNFQSKGIYQDQWSSELRFSSPTGGMIEWMLASFYQNQDLDSFANSMRTQMRTSLRYNDMFEDVEWRAVLGSLTFNFLDDNKMSIDVGGRYSDIIKTTGIIGWGATWVFDSRPCNPSSLTLAQRERISAADIAACTGVHPNALPVPANLAMILVTGPVDTANLWTLQYNASHVTPPNWLPSQTRAVGLTERNFYRQSTDYDKPNSGILTGPIKGDFSSKEIDPQVVLRYRPTDNISVYAKWAQAFKSGGFDTGTSTIPENLAAFGFAPEYAETYEIGAKGIFMDGRARYEATLFNLEFTDLQLSVSTSDPNDPFANINAGGQRVRGLEFSTAYAVSNQLRVGFAGALLDGVMTDFDGAPCTEAELFFAAETGCDVATKTIDRTGQEAGRSPDWKFVFDADYWMAVFNNQKLTFTAKAYYSDGYLPDADNVAPPIKFDTHGDMNLTLAFGDMDDTWSVQLFGRNLLGARPTYYPENNLERTGSMMYPISPTAFTTYGVQLTYNYR